MVGGWRPGQLVLRTAGQSLSNYTVQHAPFVDEEIGPNKARGLPKIITAK